MSIDTRDIGSTRMIFEDRERLREENAALRAHNAQLVAVLEAHAVQHDFDEDDGHRPYECALCLGSGPQRETVEHANYCALFDAPTAALEAIRAVQRAWIKRGSQSEELDCAIAGLAKTFGEPT